MSELLRLIAGELSPQAAAHMQSHVRDCSSCAAHLRGWDETLEAYRRHAPGAREGLPRWDRFDEALRREEDTWRRARGTRTRRQWAAAAAIVLTVLGCAWFWQRTEVVLNAEAVITRAVQHEQKNPSSGAAAVWIRETDDTVVRAEGSATHTGANDARSKRTPEVVSNRGQLAQELATRLAAYEFNWATPLSAQPLRRWRASAQDPQDRLLLIDPALFKVSTTTTAGAIRHAEIVVRQQTYETVSQHWWFADGFEVELTSLRPEEPSLASPPVVVGTGLVKTAAPPIDLEAVELDLRSTLQQLSAPVGSALTIQHRRGRIRVDGTVEASEAARQIAAYARERQYVDARVIVGRVALDRDDAASPELRAWLDLALRNDDLREEFVGRTWQLLDSLQISVSALEELARRYTSERAMRLSPGAQRKLIDLAAAQYVEVTTRYEALERQLAPLVGTVSRPVMPAALPADWRRVGSAGKDTVDQLSAGLATAFAPASAGETPSALEQRARDVLRPALEALAAGIAGQP